MPVREVFEPANYVAGEFDACGVLLAELRNPSEEGPEIFVFRPHVGNVELYVVWDGFAEFHGHVRSRIIRHAFHSARLLGVAVARDRLDLTLHHPKAIWSVVTVARGYTRAEAVAVGLG